jgi:hypothetical protein
MIMILRKVFISLFIPSFLWLPTFAQKAEEVSKQDQTAGRAIDINGFIRDKESGEPLPYANVYLKDTQLGAATNVHGYYVITGIPAGEYTLVVSFSGFETVEKTIQIQPGVNTRFDFELFLQAIETEVEVTAERIHFEEDVEISRTNITPREIQSVPAFIESDVFRAIQQLPSVTSLGDFSSALIVRGGSPDENLVMVDGAEIYNPFHLVGLFSSFNTDAISDAEFLAGGYPAEYPGRLSSVLNITSKEGNSRQGKLFKNKSFGKYWDISDFQGAFSLLSAKGLAEGPFYKGAWILSGRRTYYDAVANLFGQGEGWAYYFWDSQFKIFSDLNDQHRITFSTFNGRDVFKFLFDEDDSDEKFDIDWDWGNKAFSLKWRFIPGPKLLSELILTRSSFDFDVDLKTTEIESPGHSGEINHIIKNEIKDTSVTEQLTWFASPRHTLTMGATLKNLKMIFSYDIDQVNYFDISEKPNVFSAFLQDKWEINERLSLQVGLRGSKYELHDNIYLDPRLGFKYLLNDKLSLKGSWGRYNQFLFTTNAEDPILQIVNFWQPVPKEFDAISNQHFIVGLERWFDQGFTGSIEAYYKPYSNVLTNNPKNDPSIENDEFISGTGRAWGVELLLRKTTGKLKGWLGYSYSYVERRFDFNGDGDIRKTDNEFSEIYPPIFSKPHSFNLTINYQLNQKNLFSIAWIVSSGRPYTPVVGKVFHGYGNPGDPYAELINISGRRHSSRYPLYIRGDIAWYRDVSLFGLKGKFFVQVINFANRHNDLIYIWDHDKSPSEVTSIGMFPIFPSIGLEFKY